MKTLNMLVLAAAMLAAACADDTSGPAGPRVWAVMVRPDSVSLVAGQSLRLQATALARDGSVLTGRGVTWTASDTTRAGVDRNGVVTARSPGEVSITARVEGKSARALARILPVALPVHTVVIGPAQEFTVTVGTYIPLEAAVFAADGSELSNRALTWASSNDSIASVSAAGLVQAKSAGLAVVTATSEGKSGSARVRVMPVVEPVVRIELVPAGGISLRAGSVRQLAVRAFAADSSEILGRVPSWASLDTMIARVTPTGVLKARAMGVTGVTVYVEGHTATLGVEVTSAVAVMEMDRDSALLAPGEVLSVNAIPRDESGGTLDRPVTWRSDQPGIATVDGSGRVTAIAAGTAHIIASSEGTSGQTHVRVANWVERGLLTINGEPTPATLVAYERPGPGGDSVTTRVEARGGFLRVLPGGAEGGRYEQYFDVWIHQDGTITGTGSYIFAGTYSRDPVTGGMSFHPYSGNALSGVRLTDGRIAIRGVLFLDGAIRTAELTFIYSSQPPP